MDKKSTEVKPVIKSRNQRYFEEQRKECSDRELQMELLYAQQILIEKMDKVRGNTNTLVWWLIVLPFIFGLILKMLGLGSLA